MPYCPRCGVEVDKEIRECPLCSFEIPLVEEEPEAPTEEIELKNYYNELQNLKKTRRKRAKQFTFTVILLGSIAAVVNNTLQDYLGNNSLTFSPYVISSISLFLLFMLPVFGLIRGWKKIILLLGIGTAGFLLSIDFYSHGIEWFPLLGFPLTILTFGSLFLIMLLIKKIKPGKLYSTSIILGAVSVFMILVELIIELYLGGGVKLDWSLQALVAAGSLALLMILGGLMRKKHTFAKLKRYLHF